MIRGLWDIASEFLDANNVEEYINMMRYIIKLCNRLGKK